MLKSQEQWKRNSAEKSTATIFTTYDEGSENSIGYKDWKCYHNRRHEHGDTGFHVQ